MYTLTIQAKERPERDRVGNDSSLESSPYDRGGAMQPGWRDFGGTGVCAGGRGAQSQGGGGIGMFSKVLAFGA